MCLFISVCLSFSGAHTAYLVVIPIKIEHLCWASFHFNWSIYFCIFISLNFFLSLLLLLLLLLLCVCVVSVWSFSLDYWQLFELLLFSHFTIFYLSCCATTQLQSKYAPIRAKIKTIPHADVHFSLSFTLINAYATVSRLNTHLSHWRWQWCPLILCLMLCYSVESTQTSHWQAWPFVYCFDRINSVVVSFTRATRSACVRMWRPDVTHSGVTFVLHCSFCWCKHVFYSLHFSLYAKQSDWKESTRFATMFSLHFFFFFQSAVNVKMLFTWTKTSCLHVYTRNSTHDET